MLGAPIVVVGQRGPRAATTSARESSVEPA
jgi:hypothetical protein